MVLCVLHSSCNCRHFVWVLDCHLNFHLRCLHDGSIFETTCNLSRGQKVPDFTLVDLNGKDVSLTSILKENDTVLVDFWAAWCSPCVASFPKLKELRSKFKQQGFEIVSVSIDRTREDWVEGSKDHELPWLSLGEFESWQGEIATLYGVRFIPKSYLIDKERCILQKDLPPDLLEEALVSHYDPNHS